MYIMKSYKKNSQDRFAIFDLDGTLIDSMKYWDSLANDYLITKGLQPEEDIGKKVADMTMAESAEYFIRNYGLEQGIVNHVTVDNIIKEINSLIENNYKNVIPLKAGVYEYLNQMYQSGVVMCIATTTSEHLARLVCERTGIIKFFSFIVSSDEIGKGKNYSDIYFEAITRMNKKITTNKCNGIKLEADKNNTVIYEDAPYAVKTVIDSGLKCVIVKDNRENDLVINKADKNVSSIKVADNISNIDKELLNKCYGYIDSFSIYV